MSGSTKAAVMVEGLMTIFDLLLTRTVVVAVLMMLLLPLMMMMERL